LTGAEAGVDSAWEQKKTRSQKNAHKSRRLQKIRCTLCWAFCVIERDIGRLVVDKFFESWIITDKVEIRISLNPSLRDGFAFKRIL